MYRGPATYLSRVDVRRAVGTVASEVLCQDGGIRTDVAKVDGLAAGLKEQKPVEALEE